MNTQVFVIQASHSTTPAALAKLAHKRRVLLRGTRLCDGLRSELAGEHCALHAGQVPLLGEVACAPLRA